MTKQHILDISTQEFATYGYNGVSMNNLAKKLEVNKATIYYHFKDKKSLYQSVMLEVIRLKREEVENVIHDSSMSGEEKFSKYIDLLVHSINLKPEIIPLSLREMANFGIDIEDGVENDLDLDTEYLISILNELNLKDEYLNIDPVLIKAIIFGSICTYFVMNMSKLKCKYKKDYNQDPTRILNYLNEQLPQFILGAICKN